MTTAERFDPGLDEGAILTSDELSRLFKCSVYGGMRRSHKTNTLVLISKDGGGTYHDRWSDGVLNYTGMGLTGGQKLDGSQNRTLAECATNGVDVYLFESPVTNKYVFVGQVVLAGSPFAEEQQDRDGNRRKVWVFPLKKGTPTGDSTHPEPTAHHAAKAKSSIATHPPIPERRPPAMQVQPVDPSCGWFGSVAEFLSTGQGSLVSALSQRHHKVMGMAPDSGQLDAWRGEYQVLNSSLADILKSCPRAARWVIVFEYELPRERGRRPDVVILTGSQVMVLEFKDTRALLRAYIDQVDAYARDLRHYHAASHDKIVDPILVWLRGPEERRTVGGVTVVNAAGVRGVIADLERRAPDEPVDAEAWIQADYSPLPSLVAAARRIFDHEPLPHIRKAQSAGIPDTIAELVSAANEARDRQELHLALITGVPGSGKTLVGLQCVYENHFGDSGSKRSAVFLSGNGPLVEVLQYALKSKVFVQDVHGFLKQYGGDTGRIPEEHVWVYDEAQRAWDADRVQEKRGYHRSEPEDFLTIGVNKRSWALMVGLIGEGQEIYLGEEAGLSQWNDAIDGSGEKWTVHCPSKVAERFSAADRLEVNEHLNLDVSLRTHLAEDVQAWVHQLLSGSLEAAAPLCQRMEDQGYRLYVTRELKRAVRYVRERYQTEEEKRFGFLGSSKGRLNSFGIPTDFYSTQRMKVGPWYYDPPGSGESCCQLTSAATEFQCQGLELDLPIVGWGADLHWAGRGWQSPPQKRSQARDPHLLRLNSYRVLLTRGRDGSVLYVPDGEPQFDADYEALKSAGALPL